ncbi:MAG: BON domain-containing protein [Acidobacteriaceae bacterium]
MDRGLNCVSSVRSIKVVAPLLLSAALLGWSAVAPAQSTDQNTAQSTDQNQAQATAPAAEQAPATVAPAAKTMPDAAVEANVLKALAGAPDLANQPMTTTTVYGVVTLSGSVESEALRVEAETIVSKTKGVQKVVDEMTLGGENANAQPEGNMAPAPPAAQAQAPIEEGSPDSDNTGSANQVQNQAPNQVQNQAPNQAPNQSANPAVQQPYGGPPPGYAQTQPVYGGQEGGAAVTVPAGALLRMRINQTLTSASAKAGDRFDGIVVNDVVADGAVAIPRGAAVQGTVVDAKKSGALSGRGELTLQLTQVTLGGKSYAIVSDVWGRATGDKAAQSVNSTAAGGVMGALIGAAAGGGRGAAIGAGVGGALGLGSAATSGSGQVYVPSEGLLTFHLAQPATVTTLSQAEMDRLAQGVPQGMQPQQLRRRYPPVYYGPYGPGYYRPYPYGYPYPY